MICVDFDASAICSCDSFLLFLDNIQHQLLVDQVLVVFLQCDTVFHSLILQSPIVCHLFPNIFPEKPLAFSL